MSVISITVSNSSEQIIAGIPKTVQLSTNIPAIIFYTLDGTTPTLLSNQYISPIFLPTNQLSVVLSIFASNGTDSSPVIVENYKTDAVDGGARLPHASTSATPNANRPDLFPFGSNPIQPDAVYQNPADSNFTVNDPTLPTIPNGFDGSGNPTGFTNLPFNSQNYAIQYSTTDAEGNMGKFVGTLPAKVSLDPVYLTPSNGGEDTDQFSDTFDPRAFVIYQDFSKQNPNDPPQINKQFFTSEDLDRVRDGSLYYNAGDESPPPSGSFVRSEFNPRTQEIKHYFYDSWANRWIISTTPYVPTSPAAGGFDGNLSQILPGRGQGGQWVYEWVPFMRRAIF